jgi:hypothetical protein
MTCERSTVVGDSCLVHDRPSADVKIVPSSPTATKIDRPAAMPERFTDTPEA